MARRKTMADRVAELARERLPPAQADAVIGVTADDPEINPTAEPDPRFDPPNDAANAAAHGMDAEEPETESDRTTEIQNTVKRMLEEAVSWYEENLEPEQAEATKYYHGEPFGDERDGRSKVVSTDVRDATLAQMPSIMEILFGPEKVVEFKPRGPEDEALSRQQTDACNYIVTEENDGYTLLHDWVQDGLVRKLGVTKVWWDESYRVEATEYTGLTEQDLAVLANDEATEDFDITATYPLSGMPGAPMLFDVTAKRRNDRGCVRVRAVPSEEFVFTPHARTLDEAPLVAHVREVASDELVALGIDPELIEKYRGKTRPTSSEDMKSVRQFDRDTEWDQEENRDDSQRTVMFAEAYVLIDADGDDIGERRLFQCIGPDFEIANGDGLGEVVDDMVPFAVWSPYRRAHTIVGDGNWDLLKDVQRIKSQVLRGTLDSLAQSITPITEVVRGKVNMADLLNPDVDKVVRVEAPGMMREVKTSFVGPDTLPVLGYFDSIKEDRTGTSKAAMGLDADSLQSSTKAAVAATLSGSQQRLKFIVRMLAETGMKRLFKLVCAMTVKHRDQPWMIRLRNQWVEVDPRHWDTSMDVIVNVGLGQGTPEDRIMALQGLLQEQKTLMQAGAPFVSWSKIRQTLSRAVEFAGYKSADEFFDPWGPEQDQQMKQQQAQQPPPPDPTMMLAQIEQMKAQFQAQLDMQKLELDKWKAQREDDRERDKIARDFALREMEIEHDHAATLHKHDLNAAVAADRAAQDADIRRQQTTPEAA